ncbi:MAG: hypothetical protein RL093_1522 [Pseudomonadota bacterium]
MLTAALAAALIQTAPAATPDLSWIAGYWLDCSNGREVSETWSDPRAGLMAGHALTVARGRVSFELSHIGPTPQGYAYVAQPGGSPPTVFVVAESTPTRVVFANAENDFPTRVIYERDGDALKARIEGEINGQAQSMEWNFTLAPLNTRCPT